MGDERTAHPERLQKRANRLWIWAVITQPVFSLAFWHHQPWWALNILFVFAGVTQLPLQYRHGRKGMLAGYLLLALMICHTGAGKLRAGRNNAGHQYGNGFWQRYTRSAAAGSHHCRAVTDLFKRVIASPGYARRNIITGHAAYSGIPPGSGFLLQANLSGRPPAFHAA
jgi:hypothetical protein